MKRGVHVSIEKNKYFFNSDYFLIDTFASRLVLYIYTYYLRSLDLPIDFAQSAKHLPQNTFYF